LEDLDISIGEVEGAAALLGFGGVCSGLDFGLNPSNKRVRNRFGARENDLAARERNLAGGSRRGAGGRRAAHRVASWGRSTLSSPAAGWKRALGPRVCPFSRADRGAPVPFSLSFSLSASKDFCDVAMHTARLHGSIILALRVPLPRRAPRSRSRSSRSRRPGTWSG